MADHGPRRQYQAGCRCLPCRSANALYMTDLRTRYASGKPPLGQVLPRHVATRVLRSIQQEGIGWRDLARRLGVRRFELRGRGVRWRTVLRLARVLSS